MAEDTSSEFVIITTSVPPTAASTMLREVLAHATPDAVPSGILYRQAAPSVLLGLDGTEDSPAITQDDWDRALSDLQRSSMQDSGSISLSDIESRAEAHRGRGHVPIFIADYAFHRIRNRV